MSYDRVIGIDVSKDKFDFAISPNQSNDCPVTGIVSNTPKGIRSFIKTLKKYDTAHVVMEATGNYHLQLETMLHEHNIGYSVVNPFIIKRFADMKMRRGKTDKADAQTIMKFGLEQSPEQSTPPSQAQQALKTINSTIDSLKKQRSQLKNMQHATDQIPSLESSLPQKAIKKIIRTVNRQLKKLEDERDRMIEKTYPEVYERMRSVVGVGPKTASTVIGYYGDLSTFETANQINAAIGINPKPVQSGTSLNISSGISKRGNARVRTSLYMAALSAAKYNRACADLYQRLVKKGKHRKTALIAVANKLVKQIFAVVKSKSTFDNDYALKYSKNA